MSQTLATYLSGFIFSRRGLGKQRGAEENQESSNRAPCHPTTFSQTSLGLVLQLTLWPLGGSMELARERWPLGLGSHPRLW